MFPTVFPWISHGFPTELTLTLLGPQAAAELYESIDAAREAVNCYIAGEVGMAVSGFQQGEPWMDLVAGVTPSGRMEYEWNMNGI